MTESCADHDHLVCTACERPMRNPKTTVADHPGTVPRQRAGICRQCVYAQKRGREASNLGPKFIIGTPCTVCTRPMRPKRTRVADAPDTVEGYNRFICRTDRARYLKAGKLIPTESTEAAQQDEAVTANITTLDQYIASRRRRGIPPTGLRKTG